MKRLKQFWKYLIMFIVVFFIVDFGVFFMIKLPDEQKSNISFQGFKEIITMYISKF